MKKIIILLMILLLCGCTANKPEPVEPEPQPQPPATEPVPAQNEPDPEDKEYVYQLDKDWIVYDFTLKHPNQTYQIKDNLILKLEGEEEEAPYCKDGRCLIYDDVELNDRDIEVLENLDVQINEDYGFLNLYNLNDELFILNFNFAAQFNSSAGVIFDKDGNIVKSYKDCDLSMNEIYQNQFGLSYTDPNNMTETRFEVYTANGTELSMEVMN